MSEHRESVKASDLKPGHLVDLESCPYLRTYPSAEFEPYGNAPYDGSGIAFAHWHREGSYALRMEWI